jgi:hypothetical protein
MKLVVLLLLAAILFSLGSGLYYLIKDGQGSQRMLQALKIRVLLSIVLIVFLAVAYWLGWITP